MREDTENAGCTGRAVFPENLRNNSAYIIADRNMGNVCKGCQTQLIKENRYEQSHCDLSVEK